MMQQIIDEAKRVALIEIEKNGSPALEHFELTNAKGQEIAKKLGANKEIVHLGTILMDLKIGECIKEGKLEEHVKRSSDAAKDILAKFNLKKEDFAKVINCIEAHHAKIKFACIEAEICANADCYRMLHPRGAIAYIKLLASSDRGDLDYIINQWESKLDEKNSILSLDICKKELVPYYKEFKNIVAAAKKS